MYLQIWLRKRSPRDNTPCDTTASYLLTRVTTQRCDNTAQQGEAQQQSSVSAPRRQVKDSKSLVLRRVAIRVYAVWSMLQW